jgi:hypothetical protein
VFHNSQRQRSQCRQCNACSHDKVPRQCSRCKPIQTFKICRQEAKKRSILFELTLDEYKWLVSQSCINCGEATKPVGVDRVHNDYGYRFDNVQPMCEWCNKMKLDRSEKDFDEHLLKIFNHRTDLSIQARVNSPTFLESPSKALHDIPLVPGPVTDGQRDDA